MPNFTPLFEETFKNPSGDRSIIYNGQRLFRVDKFPISKKDTLIVTIEEFEAGSDLQGVCIDVTGYIEMNGEKHKKGKGLRVLFWGNDPEKIHTFKIFTKLDFVWVYNVWEIPEHIFGEDPANGFPGYRVAPTLERWSNGAAMIVEEIENGRRYRCNDGAPDEDFNDIVFTVQRAKPE